MCCQELTFTQDITLPKYTLHTKMTNYEVSQVIDVLMNLPVDNLLSDTPGICLHVQFLVNHLVGVEDVYRELHKHRPCI